MSKISVFIRLIPAIGTKYSLAKGPGAQYRDVSELSIFCFYQIFGASPGSLTDPALDKQGSREDEWQKGRVCSD